MSIYPDPPDISYNISSGKISWDAVTNADGYIIEYSTDDEHFSEWWTGSDLSCDFVPSPPGIYYIIGRSKNGGDTGPPGVSIQVNTL